MSNPNSEADVKTLVNNHIKSADFWADLFRVLNVVFAVIIAGLGAMVAAKPEFGPHTAMVLGVLTSVFGALNKAIDPGETGEKAATRKRALELLKVEVDRADTNSPFDDDEIKRLIYRAKRDATSVLEEVIKRTTKSAATGTSGT